MFENYNLRSIRAKQGFTTTDSAFSKFIEGKQFSATNRGREFGGYVMDIFSRYNTYVETAKQSRDDSPTYYPLSEALKGREFKFVEENEQEYAPGHLHQEQDEVYQYHNIYCNSLMSERASAADVDEHTIYNIASEMAKLRQRDSSAAKEVVTDMQIAKDAFESGTPTPKKRPTAVVQNIQFGAAGLGGNLSGSIPGWLSYDAPGQTVVVTEAEVQAAIIPLRDQNLRWVYNARFIRDNDFFDIKQMACDVLKRLVVGPFEYLVKDVTPATFMNVLRGLVIGEAQTSTQRAAELCAFINGIPLDAPPGFVAQTHPLLLQHHDIPAFMDAMEAKFKCLRALDVADEYKIHADLFLKTIMMFIGPFISSLTERYHRKLGTSQPFDLKELKGLLYTYETSRYLDRSKSTAFMAASALAHTRPGTVGRH